MNHADGRPKKVKTSSFARRTLATSTEEPKVFVVSPSALIVSSKSASSKTHLHYVNNSSSFPSTTFIPLTHIYEQVHYEPMHTSKQLHSEPAHTSEQGHSKIVPVEQSISAP